MSFDYKNPTSSTVVFGPTSVTRDNVIGTDFSVEGVGGYMEVFNLTDLDWTIPTGITSGTIYYSGNSIPISFNYNSSLSLPNQVYVNDDQISSGRRRLGMMVYVYETDTLYQYHISNYETLWNDAETAGSIINIGTGYFIQDDTVDGAALLNSWTASTIEGVSGYTSTTARWRIFSGGTGGGAVTSVTAGFGLSGNTTVGAITLVNTAPDQTVTITGGTNIEITGSYPDFGVNFTGSTSGSSVNIYNSDGTLTGDRIVNLSSYTLNFSSSTNPNTLVMSGGNIGIGTSSPNSKLDVSGWINSSSGISINGASWTSGTPASGGKITFVSGTTLKYSPESGAGFSHSFFTNGFSRLFINDTGVGIGTTSPSYKLDVNGTGRFVNDLYADTNLIVNNYVAIDTTSTTNPNTLGIWRRKGNGYGTFFQEDEQGGSKDKWAFIQRTGYGGTRQWFNANSSIVNINYGWQTPNSTNYQGSTLLIDPVINITGQTGTIVRGIYYNPTLSALTGTTHVAFENTTGDVLLGTNSGNLGVGTSSPSNKLHVSATTDPARFVGVQSSTDTDLLTIDGTGVVHKRTMSSITAATNNIYTIDGTLTSTRTVTQAGLQLNFSGGTMFINEKLQQGVNVFANGTASHAEGRNNIANGNYSHAEGFSSTTTNQYSHAEGRQTTTSADYSHAEGYLTNTLGSSSHAEGRQTTTVGLASHTEGYQTTAFTQYSHAEGRQTQTNSDYAHAEGYSTQTTGIYAHAEGYDTNANGDSSHSEGRQTTSVGSYSHAEGYLTTGGTIYSHAEGKLTRTAGSHSHAEGEETVTNGSGSHAEGFQTTATGSHSHSEGNDTTSIGVSSHAEGNATTSTGNYSHAEGDNTNSIGISSHAEGSGTVTNANYSHAEGRGSYTNTTANYSHSEGHDSVTTGLYSHAEGSETNANGEGAHSEGYATTATGDFSHSEGHNTFAIGEYSSAEGEYSVANGLASKAIGQGTQTDGDYQFAFGKYNITGNTTSLGIIGNGLSNSSRSNLVTFNQNDVSIFGDLYVSNNTTTNGLNANTISATTYTNLPGSSPSNCLNTLYVSNISGCSPVTILTPLNISEVLSVTGNTNLQELTATTISATTYNNLPNTLYAGNGSLSGNRIVNLSSYTLNFSSSTNPNTLSMSGGNVGIGTSSPQVKLDVSGDIRITSGLTATTISSNSISSSASASTINLTNTTQQQIRFFSGGTGAPTLTNYSAGAKIILSDSISSIGSAPAIGVSTGAIWYGTDLPGDSHDWYGGSTRLMNLSSSLGLRLFGLGGPTTTAMVISGTSALGSKGGTGYMDFLQVTNNWSAATNPNKWFRVNITGGLEILRSDYGAAILTLSDSGIMAVGGGNLATTSNSDGVTNYLSFGNNNTQIYDDGNTHIHSRGANQVMWINTNGGGINIGTQSPVAGGSIASSVNLAVGTVTGYFNINTGRTFTDGRAYGFLSTGGAGTYPGGSQSVTVSLYATNRIWGQEIDAFSDERMKDIQGEVTLDEGLKLVNNLKPIKYTWKNGEDKGLKVGYSAQQVSKAGFDHLIALMPREGLKETIDDDGFVSPKDTQFSMNYDQVTPYHGVVLKHLLDKIEQLEKEIKELKNT